MKTINILFATLSGLTPLNKAHYHFNRLVIGGNETEMYKYVRKNTSELKYMPTKFFASPNNLTLLDTDFRCNLGATNVGVETAEVAAGSQLAMKFDAKQTFFILDLYRFACLRHPITAASYDSSGNWFKIHQERTCKTGGDMLKDAWCTWARMASASQYQRKLLMASTWFRLVTSHARR
jgi:hypothetical protein